MSRILQSALAAVIALAAASCTPADMTEQAERLSRSNDTTMAVKCADDAYTHLDDYSQEQLCRLTVAYFRISERATAAGDTALASSSFERFRKCYQASLSPDTALANELYQRVNLHVPAMFHKFGLEDAQ